MPRIHASLSTADTDTYADSEYRIKLRQGETRARIEPSLKFEVI